jgi:hypothetical protein
LEVFPEQVTKNHLHILVELPSVCECGLLLPMPLIPMLDLLVIFKVDVSPPLLDSQTIQGNIDQVLSKYRKDVAAYLGKSPHYRTWQSPSKDPRVVQHVSDLAIPMIRGIDGPSLLLHQTGVKIDPNLISEVFSDTAGDMCVLDCCARHC